LELKGHTSVITNVSFSPDGKTVLTSGHDQTVRTWDAGTAKPLVELKGITSSKGSVSFSPDGTRIVTCMTSGDEHDTRGKATVWDAGTGKALLELKGRTPRPSDGSISVSRMGLGASFSPDGTTVLTVGGDAVGVQATVRDARTGAEVLDLIGIGDNVG